MAAYFVDCSPKAMEALSRQDPVLGAVIARMGPIRREGYGDPFSALVRSVVGQLISRKAAETVWNRLSDAAGSVTPAVLSQLPVEQMRACGLSQRKAESIQAIAQAVENGLVDFAAMEDLPDDEIAKRLSTLPGVGVWTAEMLMLFSLGRSDVVSYDDLGIRRGMMRLYGLETLSKREFKAYRARYSPYGSTASLYLWALWGEQQGEQRAAGI